MKKPLYFTLAAFICALALTACNKQPEKPKNAGPVTEDEKTLYAIGVFMSKQLSDFALTPEEMEHVKKGMADGVSGAKPLVEPKDYLPKIQALQVARMEKLAEKNLADGNAYLDKASKEAGATKTASGIVIKHTQEGTGASPAATDEVKVHYAGHFINGEEFDSSIARGEPAVFPLNRVIACWTEGVQTMKVGGKAQFVCPANLAYGPQGKPPSIPAQSTLVFDVELFEILKPEAPAKPEK